MRSLMIAALSIAALASGSGPASASCGPCCEPKVINGLCVCRRDQGCCYSFCNAAPGMCHVPTMPDCGYGVRLKPPDFAPVVVALDARCRQGPRRRPPDAGTRDGRRGGHEDATVRSGEGATRGRAGHVDG